MVLIILALRKQTLHIDKDAIDEHMQNCSYANIIKTKMIDDIIFVTTVMQSALALLKA